MKLFTKLLTIVLITGLVFSATAFAAKPAKKNVVKNITVTGVLKKIGKGSLKRHGGYYVKQDGRKYVLKSKQHLSQFVNKKVAVFGKRVNNLKGHVTVVKVTSVILLPEEFTGVLTKEGDNYVITNDSGKIQLDISGLTGIVVDDLLGKTVEAEGESSLAPDNTTIIFKVASIYEVVDLVGTLNEYEGLHIAIPGISIAYFSTDSATYILISKKRKINLEDPANYGKTATVTGLLVTDKDIILKSITVSP